MWNADSDSRCSLKCSNTDPSPTTASVTAFVKPLAGPRLPKVSITFAWQLRPSTTSTRGADMAGEGVTVDRNTS